MVVVVVAGVVVVVVQRHASPALWGKSEGRRATRHEGQAST